MNQRIGNVGRLNLLDATEESIKGIERIENVGVVLYKKKNMHLLSMLNIGNLGATIEIPDDYTILYGSLHLDDGYFHSLSEPIKLFVLGDVIVDRGVQPQQLKESILDLKIKGHAYCPAHLYRFIIELTSGSDGSVEVYDSAPPRFEKGTFTLTNSYLSAITEPLDIIIKGMLTFSKDLDMSLFDEKINKLDIKGYVKIYEEQEPYVYQKTVTLSGTYIKVIPKGYLHIDKSLHVNSRKIRRFKHAKIHTEHPIVIEADVSREAVIAAFDKIHSSSIIICPEDLEDLFYEINSKLETEILSFAHSFVFIEGEDSWSNEQFLELDHPVTFIVTGQLTIEEDVVKDVLQQKLQALDIFGKVIVEDKKIKGTLQQKIRVNEGVIEEQAQKQEAYLSNVGELSL